MPEQSRTHPRHCLVDQAEKRILTLFTTRLEYLEISQGHHIQDHKIGRFEILDRRYMPGRCPLSLAGILQASARGTDRCCLVPEAKTGKFLDLHLFLQEALGLNKIKIGIIKGRQRERTSLLSARRAIRFEKCR